MAVGVFLRIVVTLAFAATTSAIHIAIPADDLRLEYVGRWQRLEATTDNDTTVTTTTDTPVMRADWPCSELRVRVRITPPPPSPSPPSTSSPVLPLVWYGERARLNVTVVPLSDGHTPSYVYESQLLVGPFAKDPLVPHPRTVTNITLPGPAGQPPTAVNTTAVSTDLVANNSSADYMVHISKLSTAAPYGTGIGERLLKGSMVQVFGFGAPSDTTITVLPAAPARNQNNRLILAVGASDTAGWCVDGTPHTNAAAFGALGWLFENCQWSYTAALGRAFDADVSVQAISGIGLTQNANAKQQWEMGDLTMPEYFNRTVQEDASQQGLWNFSLGQRPDVILVSLGGNDYNHQDGMVPTNATFTRRFGDFARFLFAVVASPTSQVVVVCGMGSPLEAKLDPDNNRCRPCPHVSDAVAALRHIIPTAWSSRLTYRFVPCDGSVISGQGDIGCNGHKNRIGQAKVAAFLTPTIADITGWKPKQE
eukprot:m.487699 g.487699  ORF g.487699 m.487699 type:complete len:480 (-) comp25210_c0_seq1:43-1482(-)